MIGNAQYSTQNAWNNYFPMLSNYRFGNSTFANLGQSNAVLGGGFTPQMNFDFAQFSPVPFQFPDIVPAPVLDPSIRPEYGPGDPTEIPTQGDGGENRLVHYFKLQAIAIVGFILLAVGLYLLSQQTETGRAIKDGIVERAETAAEVAAVV